ncbi:MAG: integrase arm-type DNA-binding domain-containing protein [Rickettsiales bacterium]
MPLTNISIQKTKPQSKPTKLFDGGGLYLLIQPSGGKCWRYKYRFAGKEKLLAFGTYPEVSLAEARERHAQARKALSAGNDPAEVKKEAKRLTQLKSENTFESIAREWHENRKHSWTPKHAQQIMTRMEANLFPKLGSRSIADINAPDLLAVAKVIEARGAHDIAHRAMQTAGQVFTYAIVTGKAERNPATDLRGALKPLVKKHHAHLSAKELPEFLQSVENYDGTLQTKLAIQLLLLTFVRTSELRCAEWKEIDLDKAEWRIPAERMKMRDPHIVPLSKQAIKVLRQLHELNGHWPRVFPSQHKPAGYMSQNTIIFAIYRMGYHSRLTGHGIRGTASTILNENGFTPDVIERQLAHAERNGVRAAYNHAQYLPERKKMMQWWADYVEKATL